MRNIDWAAAYQEVNENRNALAQQRAAARNARKQDKGMGLQTGLKGFTDAVVGGAKQLGKAVQVGAQQVGGAARNIESARTGGQGNQNRNKPKPTPTSSSTETEAQREARRAKVGLSGNAGPERAAASQAAAQPKIDAANQARKDNKAAGKVSSTLPSDYKKTETKAFNDADKFRAGAGTSSLPRSVQSSMNTPKPKPEVKKPELKTPKFDTSGVGSGTSNFSKPTPKPTPKPSGSSFGRRPTGRSEMRAANISRTQNRPRPSAPKPMASTPKLDSALSGIKPMSDEFKMLGDAYDKMYQLDELFPGALEGAGAALAGPIGAGAAGAITGKKDRKMKKSIGAGTGAAVGGALGGPLGAVIGGGLGGAVAEGNDMSGAPNVGKPKPTGQKTDVKYDKKMGVMAPNVKGVKEQAEAAYDAWLQEQITAGKHTTPQV